MIGIFKNQSFLFLLQINMIAALGMNLVYATGQLNLGQAGFLAIGAYTTAVIDKVLGWPLAASLAASALAAALVALPVALGANRVRGIYLIMGTLAVGEVVRIVIGNVEAVGGLQGYSGIRPVSLSAVTITLILVFIGAGALMASPLGLKMRSVFDDEDAAAAAGVPTRRVKVISVVVSAAVVAIAGGLMAKWLLFIAPRNFGIDVSFRIALFTLIGGVHSLLGAIVGAFSVTYLLEVLKRISDVKSLPEWVRLIGTWRLVIYGALIMLLMAVRPEGLVTRQWGLFLGRPWRALLRRMARRRPVVQWANPRVANPSGNAPLLELSGISHDFGGIRAVRNVSLRINRGEILALIGANGAGKTTLTNVVSGRFPLQEGSVRLLGVELAGFRPERRTLVGISRTFQTVRMFAHLTVEEHLRLGWFARGDRQGPSLEEILALIGLEDKLDALPESLTLAEQRRLEIGRAIASAPYVVFLDEPSAGMNEEEREELAALIRSIRDRGVAVVLIDHNLDLAFGVADRVAVMDFGELLAVASPDEVFNDPRVRAAYLGTAEVNA